MSFKSNPLRQQRRKIIKTGMATLAVSSAGILLFGNAENKKLNNVNSDENVFSGTKKLSAEKNNAELNKEHETAVRDNLQKVKDFDKTYSEDVFLAKDKHAIFQSALHRILRVQKTIGYANFNLVSFDDMLLYAHRFPRVGKFLKAELDLIDEIFFYDANKYGFYGDKVIKNLTSIINKKETVKVAGSGHYLFQGEPLMKFKQLKKDVGPDLVLTSGVRSVVKQIQLFLAKLDSSNGNLSMASRSLAPPGHSYHGIGDFDVGKRGFGRNNFTSKFSQTDEYKKLIELKYIDLRYTQDNQVGVRYEPWHIKVV